MQQTAFGSAIAGGRATANEGGHAAPESVDSEVVSSLRTGSAVWTGDWQCTLAAQRMRSS